MHLISRFAIGLFLMITVAGCSSGGGELGALPEIVDYNWHIKPILSDRCYKCHGPDDRARKAELRLDVQERAYGRSREDSLKHIIVPGSAASSVLIEHITSSDANRRMPPPESNLALSAREIALIRKWINQGAPWKSHWAFTAPVKPAAPSVRRDDWVRSDIDRFVLARLESEGLEPSAEADAAKLLRRVTFDLTGLPPTPTELDAFLDDAGPEAYERAVDRLLTSPAYGERMASLWLDVARYADTHGYQDDRPRTMWPWRDWVVGAFNDNMRYDDFVIWQIAGDMLPDATYEQRLATGFNRNHAITQEGGVVPAEYITEYVADRTNTTATAFLGLTMECARCHDHKYDPILQEEYYSMFAFFNGIDEQAPISYFDLSPRPTMRIEDAALEADIARTLAGIDSLEAVLAAWPLPSPPAFWQADFDAALLQDLYSHLALDTLAGLTAPSQAGLDGQANLGLENDLEPPGRVKGYIGQGLEFDGLNFLNLTEEADFEWYDAFSLGAWVQPYRQEKDAALVSKRIDEQKLSGYDLTRTKDGNLRLRLRHDAQSQIAVTTQRRVPAGTWTHVFATYDGSGIASGVSLYLNGRKASVQVDADSLARLSILNGTPLLAGNWTHRKKVRADIEGLVGGALDELRIYTRELSAPEVAHIVGLPAGPLDGFYRNHNDPDYSQTQLKLDSLRRALRTVPNVMIMEEMETPRPTYVLDRGAYDAPTDSVGPDTPNAILAFPEDIPRNRLGLAQWLVHEDNPLTARVAANRFWQMLFGEGLVHTPEDFGSQGALPSQPQLLDYLAVSFMESGWNIKALLKDIVTSATYRQRSALTPALHARDPDNLLLARGPRVRLSAEMMRDNALLVSGLLDPAIGGEPVRPYQPIGLWKALANQVGENRYRLGPQLYRRSLYTYWKRTIPPPSMLTFDAPERVICTVERQTTATPLQSLVLMNDPQFVEAARVLAERLLQSEAASDRDRMASAFRWLTSRHATNDELHALEELLEEQLEQFEAEPARARQFISVGRRPVRRTPDVGRLAALTLVTSTIMNLDEAQYR